MSWKGLIASKGFDLVIMQQLLTETSDLGETLGEWGSLILETVSSYQTCFFILYLLPGWTAQSLQSLLLQLTGWEPSAPPRLSHLSCGQDSRTCSPWDPLSLVLNLTLVLWRASNSEITEKQLASIDHSQLSDGEKTSRKSFSQYMGILQHLTFLFNSMN